jgi:hypothetical protein
MGRDKASTLAALKAKYQKLSPWLNEYSRRYWAATEAESLGYGGMAAVGQATGLALNTIGRGVKDLAHSLPAARPAERQRQPGGGRKPLTVHGPQLLRALEVLVEPYTRGDPVKPLRWTCKSVRVLAKELRQQGHGVGPTKVAELLHELGYSLQSNRKSYEGKGHPDRAAQFEYINARTLDFQRRRQPVISVDTKKEELIGSFRNSGREWRPKGCPEEVNVYDFPDSRTGKAIPYGVYDVRANKGWVNVGRDHDTAEFAVESLRRWWKMLGQPTYPQARELLIMADSGGSNSYRSRLWKYCLQHLADQAGLRISVCHFPPATSKWNKIEHRLFCHITANWRGRPLTSYEVVVNLIGATTTRKGLKVQAQLDTNAYPTGKKLSDEEMATVRIKPGVFHGDWNYTILPHRG